MLSADPKRRRALIRIAVIGSLWLLQIAAVCAAVVLAAYVTLR
jgi:hypothetical protein